MVGLLFILLAWFPLNLSTNFTVEIITFTAISPKNIDTSFPWVALAFNAARNEASVLYPEIFIEQTYVTDPSFETCEDMTASAEYLVSRHFYRRTKTPNMTALVYSGCTESVSLNRLAAGWNILMLTSVVGVDNPTRSKGNAPTWVTASMLTYSGLEDFLVNIFNLYNWRSISFVRDERANPWFVDASRTLQTAVRTRVANNQIAYFDCSPELLTDDDKIGILDETLMKIQRASRMYLGSTAALRIILARASKLGMTNGEYVYIAVEPYPHPSWGNFSWKGGDELDQVLEIAWRSIFLITLSESELSRKSALAPQFPKWRSQAKEFYYFELPPGVEINYSLVMSYEAIIILAKILAETLSKWPTFDFSNGTAVSDLFRNRTVEISSGSVRFNELGVRTVDLVLRQLDAQSNEMRPVMAYHAGSGTVSQSAHIDWYASGGPPPNEPRCGFRNDKLICDTEQQTVAEIAGGTVVGCMIVITILFIVYRHCIHHRHAPIKYDWEVSALDLEPYSSSPAPSEKFSLRRESNVSWSNLTGTNAHEMLLKGHWLYKGHDVWIKNMSSRGKFVKSAKLVTLMQNLTKLQYPNLNPLIGICQGPHSGLLVLESMASKGSLHDMISAGLINQDFQRSFIQDLIEGVQYIHMSVMTFHGYLSSHNCLITNRFTLVIAELGYYKLAKLAKANARSSLGSSRSQVCDERIRWMAPEVLRNKIKPNQKSDIYSVGVILAEISTNKLPYYGQNLEEVTRIILSGTPLNPFSMESLMEHDINLAAVLEKCFHTDYEMRPSIANVKSVLFRQLNISTHDTLVARMLQRVESHTLDLELKVAQRTTELLLERQLCDMLLQEMLPKAIIEQLRLTGFVEPKMFDFVTIYFSDIVGFQEFAVRSSPFDVIDFLNLVYQNFDMTIKLFDVFKVETIGDSYVVASGLPVLNGVRHVAEIGAMALSLLNAYRTGNFQPDTHLRVGIHSGPVAAGVVGHRNPRYCLFGDTMNTASRMESHGLAGRINVSSTSASFLKANQKFRVVSRGKMTIKGKGEQETYWLESSDVN